jgi:ABC-type proline/glycine betaine transport system permease subunit
MSHESALESELRTIALKVRAYFASHDRGVVFGFFLALTPVPPVALFGFLISTFNLWLWRRGKISFSDGKLIKISLLISGAMVTVFSILYYYLATVAITELPSALRGFATLLRSVSDSLPDPLRFIFGLRHSVQSKYL